MGVVDNLSRVLARNLERAAYLLESSKAVPNSGVNLIS